MGHGLVLIRDQAELTEHTEGVPNVPAFDDLAVCESVNPNAAHVYRSASGWNPGQVSTVHSGSGPACDNAITGIQHFFNGPVRIRNAALVFADQLFHAFRPRSDVRIGWIVVSMVACEDLFRDALIPPIAEFFKKTVRNCLVFCRHEISPLDLSMCIRVHRGIRFLILAPGVGSCYYHNQ